MKTKWIAILIMLLAGATASVIFLLQGMALAPMIINLEIVMLVFYLFGKVIEKKITKLNKEVSDRERKEILDQALAEYEKEAEEMEQTEPEEANE